MTDFDIVAVTFALVLLSGYHIYLYVIRPKVFGASKPYTLNVINSEIWVQKHREKGDTPTQLLAIQTLRNTMTAAVFVGGNALYIAYDLSDSYVELTSDREKLRSVIITLCMFCSFLCWANVTRLTSVVGYLVGTMHYAEKMRAEAIEKEKMRQLNAADANSNEQPQNMAEYVGYTPMNSMVSSEIDTRRYSVSYDVEKNEYTAQSLLDVYDVSNNMLKLIALFFSYGFRLIFVSLPFAFFNAGPVALIVTTVVLLLCLRSYDHAILDRRYTAKPEVV